MSWEKERLCAATALDAALKQLPNAAEWGSYYKPFVCNYGGAGQGILDQPAYNSMVQDVGQTAADEMWDSMVLDWGAQSKLQDDSSFLVVCMDPEP